MVIARGDLWWANLPRPVGSEGGFRRPILVIQSNAVNDSRIATVIVTLLTSNLDRANDVGNVLVRSVDSGLPRHSVVNVSQVAVIDKAFLEKRIGTLSGPLMEQVDVGLRRVLGL